MTENLCECGCGLATTIAARTNSRTKQIKGQPVRFIQYHALRNHRYRNEMHPSWKGGRTITVDGYVAIKKKDSASYVREHILIAEHVLGRSLPSGAVIHHANGIRTDNRHCNLVICQNHSYHMLLHVRAHAFKMTGNALAMRCWICKKYDEAENLTLLSTRNVAYHGNRNRKKKREQQAALRFRTEERD